MLRDVAAILDSEIHPFELGVACEVFGLDRSDDDLPSFDFAVCAPDPRPIPTVGGLTIEPRHGLERTYSADLVMIPAWRTDKAAPKPEIVTALHAAVQRGATVLSVCSGVFLLAAAGLLEGRRVTCHWHDAERLHERYPDLVVDANRLYVEDGPVVTSAGTAAGIDACLHIVRRERGAAVANGFARRMVVPPHREGGQAQYVYTPVPGNRAGDACLGSLLEWLQAHLQHEHSVASLAAQTRMSPRTFARRFADSTGTTPHRWITRQRVLLAQHLLEQDTLEVEEIARRTGFGTAEVLRHHFTQQLETTPTAYRARFSHQLRSA